MAACIKQVSYSTPLQARLALAAILRAHPERSERGIHPCSSHHAWHLTSHRGSPIGKKPGSVDN